MTGVPISYSTGTFGVATFVVAQNTGQGQFTTIGAALAAAGTAHAIIYIAEGTYSENITLKPNVMLCSLSGAELNPNVIISGKTSYSSAGLTTISGICLQTDSDYCLSINNSSAHVKLQNCFLYALNNTAVQITALQKMEMFNCKMDTGTTGVTYFSYTANNAALKIFGGYFENNGASSTANTFSGSGGGLSFIR